MAWGHQRPNVDAFPAATGQPSGKVAETDGAGGWTFIDTPTAGASGTTVEAATVDGTTGAVKFRWGIDAAGRPFFDSTGAVTEAQAARLLIGTDGRFYVEDL